MKEKENEFRKFIYFISFAYLDNITFHLYNPTFLKPLLSIIGKSETLCVINFVFNNDISALLSTYFFLQRVIKILLTDSLNYFIQKVKLVKNFN